MARLERFFAESCSEEMGVGMGWRREDRALTGRTRPVNNNH